MRSALAFLLLIAATAAHAQTGMPKAKSVLSSEITSCFPDQFTGAITPGDQRNCLQDFLASWQQYAGVNPQVGTSYTIQTSDYGQLLTFSAPLSAAVAVVLPQAVGSFGTFNVYVKNLGNGTATITPVSGTIGGSSNLALTNGQSAWIVSDGTNYQTWGTGGGVGAAAGLRAVYLLKSSSTTAVHSAAAPTSPGSVQH